MASIDVFAAKSPQAVNERTIYDRLLDNPPRLMSVDIETRSLTDRSIVGVGFGLSPTEAYYVPFHSPVFYDAVMLLCDVGITKVCHNIMFDLPELVKFCPEIDAVNILDTMHMCHMEGLPMDLGSIADVFGMQIKSIKGVNGILPDRMTMDQLEDSIVADKCMDDCLATMLVFEKLWPEMNQDYFKREMALIPVLMRMNMRGVKIDQERRQQIEDTLTPEVELYRSLAEAEGFNPASNQQVAYVLMQRGSHLSVKRGKRSYSACVDEEVLSKLDDPMAALVLNFRKVNKLRSTYVLPFAGLDRVHTRFHMNAATRRISSSKPNMQNIPAGPGDGKRPGLRTMFVPDSGTWTDFDFSQQELRTLAYMSQDPDMLYIYEHNLDIHQETADYIGIDRKPAKNVNFAALYGASDLTIAETAGIRDIRKAAKIGEMWRIKYRKAAEWIEAAKESGLAKGYVETLEGCKLWLPPAGTEREEDRARKAVNYPIQGSAAEIMKKVIMKCAGYELALQVYDELVIDNHIEAEELRAMGLEDLGPFHCPISVRHFDRWQ